MLADHIRFGCSIEEVLHYIDNSIQYGEDADVKIRDFENEDAEEPDEWHLFVQWESASLTGSQIMRVYVMKAPACAVLLLTIKLSAWNYETVLWSRLLSVQVKSTLMAVQIMCHVRVRSA